MRYLPAIAVLMLLAGCGGSGSGGTVSAPARRAAIAEPPATRAPVLVGGRSGHVTEVQQAPTAGG